MLLKKFKNPQALFFFGMLFSVLGALTLPMLKHASDFTSGLVLGVLYGCAIVAIYRGFKLRRQGA